MTCKRSFKVFILAVTILFTLPGLVLAYGYGDSASEDPVLTAFKDSIAAVKANDWDKVDKVIDKVSHTISSMDKFFGFNLLPELKKSVEEKDFKQVVKLLANLIYLSMVEKFDIMAEKELKDADYSKQKIEICKIYYTGVLRGNVKSYDKKNKTTLDNDIAKSFSELEKIYSDPSKLGEFKKQTENIKNDLNKAFDYFVFKK